MNFFYILKPSLELLVDLSPYMSNNNLNFHDSKVLKDGYYKNQLYGIPYEIDFDLLYYNSDDDKTKKIVDKMETLTWDDLLESIKEESYPMTLSLADDDDMLNFMIEYAYNHFNITKEYDPSYFNVFYNETANEFFTSYFDFIMNISDQDVENSLYLNQEDAIYSFLDGESTFLKTKTSFDFILNDDEHVLSTLPPKYITTLTEKYLVVSKESKIDLEILTAVAKELTSKEMQIFRADHFGTIPTFDFTKKDTDSDIKSYCESKNNLCNMIENMNRLYMKDTFNSKYSPSFFEIEYLLPQALRDNIESNNIDYTKDIFKNTKEVVSEHLGAYSVLSYIITIISGIIGFVVMYYVYKYREHPYIKVVSPIFCNIIIFGFILNIFAVVIRLPPYYNTKARIFLIYNTIKYCCTYVPMFVITYRIYKIYNSKLVISNTLSNKRLLIIFLIILFITTTYRTIIAFIDDFYYMSYGDITDGRFPMYEYNAYDYDHIVHENYLYTLVSFHNFYLYKNILLINILLINY